MSSEAFIDANVVMYAAGTPHPYMEPSAAILDFAAQHPQRFISSAEVMQELLNAGLRRANPPYAARALQAIARACGHIEPVTPSDVFVAAGFDAPRLSARDRIHLAVMQRLNCTHIVTTDRAFEAMSGVTRLDPLEFERWREDLADD